MAPLLFSADADRQLSELGQDPSRQDLLQAVNVALDEIEADSTAAAARKRRYQDPPMWGVTVRTANDDWLILWADTTRGPLILYIGEDPR